MNSVLAAILATLSFATGDNINGVLSKRNSALKIAVWETMLGSLIFILPAIIFFQNEIAKIDFINALWLIGTSIFVDIGYLAFVTGLNKGNVTLTGVIAGSFPAVTTIIALLFFDETLSLVQAGSILLIFTGIILAALHSSAYSLFHNLRHSSLKYAFIAFFLWGIYFAIVRIPIERVGWFMPQYISNIIGLITYLTIAIHQKEPHIFRKPKYLWLFVLTTTLQMAGTMSFNYAIGHGITSIVAPIAGSSPAIFAIIAYFVFKERLTKLQTIGVIAALTGVISLSIVSR